MYTAVQLYGHADKGLLASAPRGDVGESSREDDGGQVDRVEGAGAAHALLSLLPGQRRPPVRHFFCGGEPIFLRGRASARFRPTHPPLASPALPRAGRSFALNQYPAMKVANPTLPILLREGKEITPKIYARFGAMQAGSQQWAMCQAEG